MNTVHSIPIPGLSRKRLLREFTLRQSNQPPGRSRPRAYRGRLKVLLRRPCLRRVVLINMERIGSATGYIQYGMPWRLLSVYHGGDGIAGR